MGRVSVVTDSSADIPAETAEALGIHMIPLNVMFGRQVFRDRVDITPQQFYRMLRQSAVLPTTSQPSAGDFLEVYRELGQSARDIISIHLSADLSGTLESAHMAKAQLDLPVDIHIIDSRTTSMGLGFVALAAAAMAQRGLDAAEIVQHLNALIPRMNVLFVVDTLEYLHRGGRIGGAERLLGTVLGIKPLLHICDGRVDALEKARTKRGALARLLAIMETRIGTEQAACIAVMHGDAEIQAIALRDLIQERFHCKELHVCQLCPALGVHTGPGLVGAAFYALE
jgi:DegV family protein with EDD domain